jgi:hypothetical protein
LAVRRSTRFCSDLKKGSNYVWCQIIYAEKKSFMFSEPDGAGGRYGACEPHPPAPPPIVVTPKDLRAQGVSVAFLRGCLIPFLGCVWDMRGYLRPFLEGVRGGA